MPIKVFQIASSVPAQTTETLKPRVLSDYSGLDEPDPLFYGVDHGELEPVAASEDEVDFGAFAHLEGAETLESSMIPDVAPSGGGGTGGHPLGRDMPFVAEDYGPAGSPDSNEPEQTHEVEMLLETPDPAVITVAPPPPVFEGLEEPESVQSEDVLEDPSKDDNVSDPIEELVYLFLLTNPNPSDQQLHMLAAALGVPKERLEECIYRMLRELLVDKGGINELSSVEDEDTPDSVSFEELSDEGADEEFTHSPILHPQNDDEQMQNDGLPDETETLEEPVGFNDGLPV